MKNTEQTSTVYEMEETKVHVWECCSMCVPQGYNLMWESLHE